MKTTDKSIKYLHEYEREYLIHWATHREGRGVASLAKEFNCSESLMRQIIYRMVESNELMPRVSKTDSIGRVTYVFISNYGSSFLNKNTVSGVIRKWRETKSLSKVKG